MGDEAASAHISRIVDYRQRCCGSRYLMVGGRGVSPLWRILHEAGHLCRRSLATTARPRAARYVFIKFRIRRTGWCEPATRIPSLSETASGESASLLSVVSRAWSSLRDSHNECRCARSLMSLDTLLMCTRTF